MAIGSALEGEAQMEYYEKEAPALLTTLKRIIGTKPKVQNTNASAYKLLCTSRT